MTKDSSTVARGEDELTWEQVGKVVDHAKRTLRQIRAKYRELGAYLVFASRHGQVDIEAAPAKVLKEFPAMLVDSPERRRAAELLGRMSRLGLGKEQLAELADALDKELGHCRVSGDVNIELRFTDLKFEQIWALKADELIDRELTPQSRVGIQIVVLNLGKAARGLDE
jgi:hypothetical protein